MYFFDPNGLPVISLVLYLAMGWLCVIVYQPVYDHVPSGGLWWTLIGGMAQSNYWLSTSYRSHDDFFFFTVPKVFSTPLECLSMCWERRCDTSTTRYGTSSSSLRVSVITSPSTSTSSRCLFPRSTSRSGSSSFLFARCFFCD